MEPWRRCLRTAALCLAATLAGCGEGVPDAGSAGAGVRIATLPAPSSALAEPALCAQDAQSGLTGYRKVDGRCLASFDGIAASGAAKVQGKSAIPVPPARLPTPTELMDWAQTAYPQFFPGPQPDTMLDPYVYRHYPESGNYLGVAGQEVYVLGPVSGGGLLYVGSLGDFACNVNPQDCPVTIVQQPNDLTVPLGRVATFSVQATSAVAVSYQWQSSPGAQGPFANIAGATDADYRIPAVGEGDDGRRFRVVVTSAAGSVATSAPALLSVSPRVWDATALMDWAQTVYPELFPGPQADQVDAQGVYRHYPQTQTWLRVNGDQVYVLGPLSGGQLLQVGTLSGFRCIAHPQDCPVTIVEPPQDLVAELGSAAQFAVQATSAVPMSFQWQSSSGPEAPFVDIDGATGASYTHPAVGSGDGGRRFRVVVSNTAGSVVVSAPATLTLDPFAAPFGARLAAGIGHGAAIRSDGTVVVWGNNTSLQLLAPTPDMHLTSATVVPGLTEVRSVAAGGSVGSSVTLALRIDGRVWSWGQNQSGILGDGSGVSRRTTPQPIPGLTRVIAIAVGSNSVGSSTAYALRENGTVWAWGYGANGELGTGELVNSQPTPVQVPGLQDIVAIAAQDSLAFAVRNDGRVFGWGQGVNLTLPYVWPAAGGRRLTPVEVAGPGGAVDVGGSANGVYLFTGANRELVAWGANDNGRLGVGVFDTIVQSPRPVAGGIAGWRGVRGCNLFSVGWTDAGLVYAWGQNTQGARWLGDPALTERVEVPHRVPGLDQVVEATCSMGGSPFVIVRRANGDVFTWGANNAAQLADGNVGNLAARYVPQRVFGLD